MVHAGQGGVGVVGLGWSGLVRGVKIFGLALLYKPTLLILSAYNSAAVVYIIPCTKKYRSDSPQPSLCYLHTCRGACVLSLAACLGEKHFQESKKIRVCLEDQYTLVASVHRHILIDWKSDSVQCPVKTQLIIQSLAKKSFSQFSSDKSNYRTNDES